MTASATAGNEKRSAAGLVDALGMGSAQLQIVMAGQFGVFFCEGITLITLNVLATTVRRELDLSKSDGTLYVLLTFVGLALGASAAGSVSDSFGRRWPTILSFLIQATCLILAAVLDNYTLICLCCLAIGFGIGFGMPPSIALTSETTISTYRISMRALSTFGYSLGSFVALLFVASDDVYLLDLDRQRRLLFAAVPCVLWCVLSFFFLPESPVFLASSGQVRLAKEGFEWMRRRNGANDVTVSFDAEDKDDKKNDNDPG